MTIPQGRPSLMNLLSNPIKEVSDVIILIYHSTINQDPITTSFLRSLHWIDINIKFSTQFKNIYLDNKSNDQSCER